MANSEPTSAVFPPAAATPVRGWITPILYGLAWPKASRQGGGTSIVAPTAPAAAAERPRKRRRVALPLHHMSLAQGSLCQRSTIVVLLRRCPCGQGECVKRCLYLHQPRGSRQGLPARGSAPEAGGGQGSPDRLALGRAHRSEGGPHVGGGE